MNLNTRVFFTVIGKPFFRRLILPLGLFLLIVSSLDPMTDWSALREQLAARESWQVTLVFTLLILFWSITAGRALRPVWGQATIAFLLRQPISHWYWVWILLPSLWVAFLPVASIWWLAPRHTHSVVHYSGFVGLCWTIILGASFRGIVSVKFVVIGSVVLATLIFGYSVAPAVAYLAIIVTIFMLPFSISGIRNQLVQPDRVSAGNLRSRWPVMTVVRRDLLCLWRLERKSLFYLVLPAVLVALLMLALRVNGQVSGRDAFLFACGCLSFALMPTFEILTRLKTRLGPELMRQRWPLDYHQRSLALLCMMGVLTGPITLVLTGLGSTMGLFYGCLFLLFAVSTIIGLIALFSRALVLATPMVGWALWLLFIHTIIAIVLSPWVYGVIAILSVSIGISIIQKGLQQFTYQSERGNLDQFV